MKMFPKIITGVFGMAACLALSSSNTQAQVLVNSGFEGVGDVNTGNGWTVNPISLTSGPGGTSGVDQGWATFGGDAGATASQSSAAALSGSYSLLETVMPGNNWGPAGAYQIISGITPGQTYTFNVWGMTDTANDAYAAGAGFLVQLGFYDAALSGVSSVENPGHTVGISGALPSSMNVWQEYSVSATAPAGYSDAVVYLMFQDNGTASATEHLYIDNASLAVPEPASLALLALGLPMFFIRRRK
jgi:PEP-CTERM motif